MAANYSQADLESALRQVGIGRGDIVFSHTAPAALGLPAGVRAPDDVFAVIHAAIRAVIGDEGTFLVPAYTYSFTKGQAFDPASTPSAVGRFPDWLREQPGALRSLDPMFSVVGVGPKAERLFRDLPADSFGPGCLYERMLEHSAKIVNIGLDLNYLTFIHHVERELGVPYRFEKIFHGRMKVGDQWRDIAWTYYVRHLFTNTEPDLTRFLRLANERGLRRSAPVGKGAVAAMACRDIRRVMHEAHVADPWFMAKGPPLTAEQIAKGA